MTVPDSPALDAAASLLRARGVPLVAFVVVVLAITYWLLFVPPSKLHSNFNSVPVIKSRFPGLGAVGFFANRYTFLSRATTKDADHPHHGIYKFNLLGKVVYHVGSTDEQVLRAILLNRDLSFSGGNSFLFAGIQGAGQRGLNDQGKQDAEEKKEMMAIAKAISPQRLSLMRTFLTSDAIEAYQSWIPQGQSSAVIDLQKSYYPLIFRFTVRLMGMSEYASSPADLAKLQKAFWQTQRNSGFWTTMMPWLPQPRLLVRLYGALTLWNMVRLSVKERIARGGREQDFAQNLIDEGMDNGKISRWVIGALLAGILNTIGTGAYTVAFLGASSELRKACRQEVISTLRRSAETRGDNFDALTAHEAISRVELSEWEEGFELLHLCFKESIRLLLTNSLNRYYPGPGRDAKGNVIRERLVIGGQPIEDDVYVTFSPPSNLHDAKSFPEPFRYDPMRYKQGQGTTDYSYIAWGAGHHKCTGMRFAKLETIVAIATLLVQMEDFVTIDERGQPYTLENVPLPDLSQGHWRAPTRYMRIRVERKGQ